MKQIDLINWLRVELFLTFFVFCSCFLRKLLSANKHVKYLYIPYTDTVVVVTCNPVSKWSGAPKFKPKYTTDEALQHVRDLYRESIVKYRYRYALIIMSILAYLNMGDCMKRNIFSP